MQKSSLESRRSFIQKSVALMALPIVSKIPFGESALAKYPIGLQLFSIRDAMAQDLKGTLQKVSAMGYQDLETYGFDPEKVGYYGLPAKEFQQLLKENKLTTSSGHYDLFRFLKKSDDELRRYVDQCIKGAKILGQRYITWPWLDPESRDMDSFKILVKKLNLVGKQVTDAGLKFAYHNHDFEFIDHNGHYGYELVMNETDPKLVKLQLDLYWAVHSSKLTPLELFKKQPGRFVMWHIKDMDKVTRDYTELGNGSIDYLPIIPHAKLAGLEFYFIEQGGNYRVNSMESADESLKFFRKIGGVESIGK